MAFMLTRWLKCLAVCAGAVLFVAACGGGGGGSATVTTVPDNGPNTVTGTTFADTVVCADLDGDGQCGESEQLTVSTLSTSTGRFTLVWTGPAGTPLLAMLTVPGPDLPGGTACLDVDGNNACDAGEGVVISRQVGLYRLAVPAGQSSAALLFPGAPGFAPQAAPQIVAGDKHLTVRWAAMVGAQDYEVWLQAVGSTQVNLSRAGIATTAARVHTITNVPVDRPWRVWVKARRADNSRIVSAAATARAVAPVVATPTQQPSFTPTLSDLPVLEISTVGGLPVVSRDDYLTASFALYADSAARTAATPLNSGALDVRGRGNSTWEFAKKPYRLRLGAAAGLLGMPSNRHWVLLANYLDKSLLRNEAAFEMSRRLGMAWTPRSRFIEVVLNGDYLGSYQLVEHVRTGANRVNIASLGAGDTTEPQVSGGYLMELDRLNPDTTFSTTRCALPITVDTPESMAPQQAAYIENYMNGAEAALLGDDFADPVLGYAAWLNVDTFVDWYIIHELVQNLDSFKASTWFYKDRNARLAIGPVWDFDVAMGNFSSLYSTDPGRATGFGQLGQRCWYQRLLQDPGFVQKVKTRWQAVKPSLAGLPDFVDAQAAGLAQSQANNFSRWTILDKLVWPNVVVTGSHAGEVEYLRYWLQRRIDWLDTQWGPTP